ncbi:MAG: transglycosylase domain-containing protein, partial [Gammaproteobacteria bacterium]
MGGFLGVMITCGVVLYLSPQLPDVETLRDIKLQTPLRIYSSDGLLMAEFGEKRRQPVQFEQIPPLFIKALLAAEDTRFYDHPGVDPKGLTRAVVELISTGRKRSGGSTITMQVARNFFLTRKQTFMRKFNEILLALQIERILTKEEILALYVNKIYLGHRSYGIGAAAQVYYGRPLSELTLAELAMIAGLPKAPSRFNPISNPERAKLRR